MISIPVELKDRSYDVDIESHSLERAGVALASLGSVSRVLLVMDDNVGWPEANEDYLGQGHRRNMLRPDVTYVGIACYSKNGRTAWCMLLAN